MEGTVSVPKTLTIFQSSTGLNTNVDQERIRWDPKKGIVDLAVAVNVDVDDTGRLSRRKGFDKTAITIAAGSLFCDNGPCLFVSGANLCQLHPGFSYTTLRSDLTLGARMSYTQVNGDIFFCNGYQSGRFNDGSVYEWAGGPYVGPDSSKTVEGPPVGHLVTYYRGRVYVAVDNVVYFTEPLSYSWVDPLENFIQFPGHIRMMRPVDDGIYLSTDKKITFLAGDPKVEGGFFPKDVADYPAIEGTDSKVDAQLFNRKAVGIAAIFTTTKGICLGLNQGFMINLTQQKISYPSASWGAGLVKEGQYIALLAS
jgi:hypothetical protein